MPKIIENIRERLLEEAQKQVLENGYSKTTIRSVAVACELGVGTVYNYFKSKDQLIATFMAADWLSRLDRLKKSLPENDREVFKSIYNTLLGFSQKYNALFSDKEAEKVFITAFSQRHKMLRGQLAEIIFPICAEDGASCRDFMAEYIAESLLTWTIAGKGFDEQYEIIKKIIK